MKANAIHIGFHFANAVEIAQTPHFENYMSWLNKKQFGQLTFLQKAYVMDSRKDPKQLLENAKSVIVLGVKYGPSEANTNFLPNEYGQIAAFAQFEDYHSVIHSKALALMDRIESSLNKKINFKIFIDSGPVMEKDFAFFAGLGWIGRNSLLIHPQYGSFIHLCCIFLDEKVEDIPIQLQDLCGECQRCVQACPTQCISNDHTINASKCISYLTIEHKGIIPRNVRGSIGSWIFGCDTCQIVCPYNSTVPISSGKLFFGFNKMIYHELNILEGMAFSENDFRKKYKSTSIQRISYEQFQRNLIIAAGNSHERRFIDSLAAFINDQSDILRAHAAWALGEITSNECFHILQNQSQIETSGIVKKEIRAALDGCFQ